MIREMPGEFVGHDDSCLVCGARVWKLRFQLGEFRVERCLGCGLGRTVPVPTTVQLSSVNDSVYTVEQRLKAYLPLRVSLAHRYKSQLEQVAQTQIRPGKKLLDVGSSLGYFLSIARDQGYEAQGVEVSVSTAEHAREQFGLDVFTGTLQAAEYPSGSFDVVTLWDVVEHVPDPVSLLSEVSRILGDDGVLAVQSPNMESTMAHLAKEHWMWWTVPDHLYHFTPGSMERLLEMLGFRIVHMETWEPAEDFLANLLLVCMHLSLTRRDLRNRALRKLAYLVSRVAWPLLVPFQRRAWAQQKGALIVAYARKAQGGLN